MPDRLSLRGALLLFATLLVVGTIGYMLTEGWSVGEAFYAAVTTVTTLGLERPTTASGKAFTIVFVLVGVATSFYILGALVVFVAEGSLGLHLRRTRMDRMIAGLHDHFIICGYGRVGRQIIVEFAREGIPFVLIDWRQESLAEARAHGHPVVTGSAASDDVLRQARLATARGLIAAMDTDAENIYVTLAARVLRPDLFIVARANQPDAEPKLQRAGANRVISPYREGGHLMAMLAVRPLSVAFVETVLHNPGGNLLLEDVQITAKSPLVGMPLGDARQRYMPQAQVLALQASGTVILSPSPTVTLGPGDTLAVVGTAEQLAALEQAASP